MVATSCSFCWMVVGLASPLSFLTLMSAILF